MQTDKHDAYEALVQFLYRAPIGLVQTSLDGTVDMLNPMSSSLLMPLVRDGSLDNLFDVLRDAAPQLRQLAAEWLAETRAQPDAIRIDAIGIVLARGSAPILRHERGVG